VNPDPHEWRIRNIERRLELIERSDPAVLVERITQMERRLEGRIDGLMEDRRDDREEMAALRKALYAAALSVAGGVVITASTLYLIFG
jgi:hypothetical protein